MNASERLKVALGLVIATRRVEHGWSQQALALHAGISTPYLGNLERGETGLITLEILTLVGEPLGLLPEELIAQARALLPTVPEDGSVERPALGRGRPAGRQTTFRKS